MPPKTKPPVLDDLNRCIHVIRGLHVMLDKDLAELYQVDVGALNRAAKRNHERFPESFRFQITTEEQESLRFQFGILNESLGKGRHRKYLPTAYTEQGVAMLSAVLRSPTAIRVSVQIIEAFVAMRRILHAVIVPHPFQRYLHPE